MSTGNMEPDALRAYLPCDGGCSYFAGPQEECSLHGRSPAELWQMLTAAEAERDAAQAALARVESLHNAEGSRWTGFPRADRREFYCTGCQQAAPCATIRALNGEEVE